MAVILERAIRREVWIDQKPYTLTISAAGFVLTEKRRRSGMSLRWKDLVSGDAQIVATHTALPAAEPAASNLRAIH